MAMMVTGQQAPASSRELSPLTLQHSATARKIRQVLVQCQQRRSKWCCATAKNGTYVALQTWGCIVRSTRQFIKKVEEKVRKGTCLNTHRHRLVCTTTPPLAHAHAHAARARARSCHIIHAGLSWTVQSWGSLASHLHRHAKSCKHQPTMTSQTVCTGLDRWVGLCKCTVPPTVTASLFRTAATVRRQRPLRSIARASSITFRLSRPGSLAGII